MKNIIRTSLAFLTLTISAAAQLPDPYAVGAFNVTDTERIERNNFVIKHPHTLTGSDTLLDIPSPPTFIRPGQVVMRKKFGADYRLYIGDLDTTAFRVFPPLYVFKLPEWSRSGQAMWYRFYTEPADNRNLDLETVYFDNERIYVQHHRKIYYSRGDTWHSLEGTVGAPYGDLRVESEPAGAEIYIYGRETGKTTPAIFSGLIAGRYEIDVFLPEHHFQRRAVNVPKDGVVTGAFQLISDIDTLLILGENQHGTLVFPHPPIDSVWRIDGLDAPSSQVKLLKGEHRITWNGGGLYKSIDTLINIPPGTMVYFNVPFTRLTGTVRFNLMPEDALLCVEGFPCYPGARELDLPSGFHTARASRHGYRAERYKFIVSHGKIAVVKIHLEPNADRDADGFLDSVDRCPNVYGMYDGCPKPTFKIMSRLKYAELVEYMETEPASFSVSAVGIINRSPANRRFHTFLSSFSGGRTGGFNNYQGITAGNIYQASYRGFMAQAELGQWMSGIRYRRPDTLTIKTESDRYIIWYDSLSGIDPAIFFPSTALSAGFKYRLLNYSVGYSLGYQWEEIVIDEIQRTSDGEFVNVFFDNNGWFHEIMIEADMFTDMFITPSLYVKIKFPFGPTARTKWHSTQAGISIRFRPINRR